MTGFFGIDKALIGVGLCIAVTVFAQDPPATGWPLTGTDIFRPFERGEVIVGPAGDVFFFETGKSTIQHYDQWGTFQGTVCRAGSGPGEVQGIIRLCYDAAKRHLFVVGLDLGKLQVFEAGGRFLQQITFPPGKRIIPHLIENGWFYLTPDFTSASNQLMLTDRAFTTFKCLYTWPIGIPMEPEQGGPPRIKMDLTADAAKAIASDDGSLIFLYLPGKPVIHILDALGGTEKSRIELDLEPLPIAASWVEQNVAAATAREGPVRHEYVAGDYFPYVHSLSMGPRGHLLVYTASHYVVADEVPLVYTRQGLQTKTEFNGPALRRIVAIRGGMAYVTTFDSEREEAGLAVMASADVNRFVSANPLP